MWAAGYRVRGLAYARRALVEEDYRRCRSGPNAGFETQTGLLQEDGWRGREEELEACHGIFLPDVCQKLLRSVRRDVVGGAMERPCGETA